MLRYWLLLFVPLFTVALVAEDWPGWRGSRGDGVSTSTSAPMKWNETQHLAWKLPNLPDGASSPIIFGENIYLTAQDGKQLVLYSIDAKEGKINWKKVVDNDAEADRQPVMKGKKGNERRSQKFHKLHNLASPTPVTNGQYIVVHYGNGMLACVDSQSRDVWKKPLQQMYGNYSIWWGHSNSPIIWNNLVISVCMQDSCADVVQPGEAPMTSYVVAHRLDTGEQAWFKERKTTAQGEYCDSYTTPMVYTQPSGRTDLLVMGGEFLNAYNVADGTELWKLPNLKGNRVITGPTINGSMLFTTQGMRGPLLGIQLAENGSTVTWQHEKHTPDSSSPVVSNGLVFIVSDNGIAQCLEAKTGLLKWEHRLPGDYKASPIAVLDRVYFLNLTGQCTIIQASDKFKKLAENKVDDETIASPAIADGLLVIRGRKTLYGIRGK